MDLNWKDLLRLGGWTAIVGTFMAFILGYVLTWSINIWLPLGALIYFVLFFMGASKVKKTVDNFIEIQSIVFMLWFVAAFMAWLILQLGFGTTFIPYMAWMSFSVEGLIQMWVFTVASLGLYAIVFKK